MSGAARFDAIDHVLALDLGGRGIARIFTPGAVHAAARVLSRARRVLIVTGFCVPPGLPETDGPPGAAVLGRALRLLGASVRYVTDPAVVPPLTAALAALGEPADVTVYPEGPNAAGTLLGELRPTHLVAVERPGRARSGEYLSARGESVSAWNRPIDDLFLLGGGLRPPSPSEGASTAPSETSPRRWRRQSRRSNRRPVTVAVGDGGNEIGMGNVHARLRRESRRMARIASVVRADHLVVAGTSNWGAYGIVTALGQLMRRPLLHAPALERRMLQACVAAGAVDGITRRAEPTVDGLPLDTQVAVVELLGRVMMEAR